MGHATGKGKEGRDRRIDNLPSLLPQESGTFLPTLRSWQDVSMYPFLGTAFPGKAPGVLVVKCGKWQSR